MMATSSSFLSMSSFSTPSSSSLPFLPTPSLSSSSSLSLLPISSLLKRGIWRREFVMLKVNCVSERGKSTAQSESPQSIESVTSAPSPSSEESTSSSAIIDDAGTGISAYKLCAALGGIGFLETSYLLYLKITGSEAFCPLGGDSCNTILTSDYSYVFGVPLPFLGMLAYGLVTALAIQLGAKNKSFNVDKSGREKILIGITTSMAVSSGYFLYILNTEFTGESCLYCLSSAVLSFSLFFITLKNSSDKILDMLGSQLVIASLVVIALTASYNVAQPVSSRLAETEMPYVETEITKESSPFAVSLAQHLRSIGAKLYGAFWCSHCLDQKEMFGREAAKLLNYVECFPDGVKKGTKMTQACLDVKLEGFPTWEINGQVLSGEKQLSELATLSGFKAEDSSQ